MDYWQVYLIAAPVIIAGLSAGLATYFLLDRVDPSADYETGWGQSDASHVSNLEKI